MRGDEGRAQAQPGHFPDHGGTDHAAVTGDKDKGGWFHGFGFHGFIQIAIGIGIAIGIAMVDIVDIVDFVDTSH